MSAVRALFGGVLVVMLHASVASTASEIGAAGPAMRLLAVASSLLLLVASWRNWPMLWNPLGRGLRWLVGERITRVAFGTVALTFALFTLVAA